VSVTFLPSLCPDCGWDLNGEPESAVLTCRNCCSAWRAADGGFEKVPCSFVPMQGDDLLFLPFWKIEAEATGITLNTYADLVHLLNLPMNVSRERREAALEWLTPAFKIGPDQYLKLSQRMTLAQRPAPPETGLPAGSLHPVTLPVKESLEGLKAVAAYSAAARNDPALHLSSIKFRCKNADLIYWPFYTSRIELIRPDRQLSIQVNALRWGRNI
jgi:hypothetical protein